MKQGYDLQRSSLIYSKLPSYTSIKEHDEAASSLMQLKLNVSMRYMLACEGLC
jgi:hypothetical protein